MEKDPVYNINKVEIIYTLFEARSVTSPTGMKMKPINRNVAMTCIENDWDLMHSFHIIRCQLSWNIQVCQTVKELTAAGVSTGLHAGRFCCVNR